MRLHLPPRYRVIHRLLAFGVLAFAACSPAPMPISQSSRDPSNPHAPEGVALVVPASSSAAPPPASSHAGHVHRAGGETTSADAGAATYVCPMHPEVTSSAPGICPKCNMKLVPKK